jgi:hypothetical protein
MTIAVLTVVIVQLYVSRPRRREMSWIGSTPLVAETSVSAPVSGEGPPSGAVAPSPADLAARTRSQIV